MSNYIIKEIYEADFVDSVAVIRESFGTVARDFGLTKENCPTNGAFIEIGRLIADKEYGNKMFGLFVENKQIGFVSNEDKNNSIYEMEKLSVLPTYRHLGYGKALIDYVKECIKNINGESVMIGIIDENKILKKWYSTYGFVETGKRIFTHLPFTVCFMELKL
jgi:Acetyltransferases